MKCSSLKYIAEVKPKYYHSTMQGSASALWCEVLGYCSRGGFPYLLPVLGLIIGPHPITTTVAVLSHVCTQIESTNKAWATKAQQDWLVNIVINSWLLACQSWNRINSILCQTRVNESVLLTSFSFTQLWFYYLLSLTSYIQNHYN
jgi:hypothetical protein